MNGPAIEPSGPSTSSPSSKAPFRRHADSRGKDPSPSPKRRRVESSARSLPHAPRTQRFLFIELFAGSGNLTSQVRKVLPCLPPQDLDLDGADFTDADQVEALQSLWKRHADDGTQLLFHVFRLVRHSHVHVIDRLEQGCVLLAIRAAL